MSLPESVPASAPSGRGGPVRADRRPGIAVALVVLGLLLLVAFKVVGSTEARSYTAGSTAPARVEVTAGRTYGLDLPGGVTQVARALGDTSSLSCALTPAGQARRQLAVSPLAGDTRALHQIATFVAPVTGSVAVDCEGLPQVFVDDADDAGTDWSGLCLLLAIGCLVVGLPLLLSVLRRGAARPARS